MPIFAPPIRKSLQDIRRDLTLEDRVIRKDLRSANWDGGGDLSGGADATATSGYLIDYDSGNAQFQNIFAEGGEIGNLSIVNALTLATGGVIRTGSSGQRVQITEADADRVQMVTAHADEVTVPDMRSSTDATKATNRIAIGLSRGTMFADTSLGSVSLISRSKDTNLNGGLDVFTDEIDLIYDATGDAPENAFWQVRKGATVLLKADDNGLVTVPGLTWQAWTPSLTNITLGNGTIVARYALIGDLVVAQFQFTLGSTSAMGTNGEVSAPVTMVSSLDNMPIGVCAAHDLAASLYLGSVLEVGGKLRPAVGVASGTYVTASGLSATIPMTWTTDDLLTFTVVYEAA